MVNNSVGVVVVSFNGPDLLEKCLEFLDRQTLQPGCVTIVDNGSSDRRVDEILSGREDLLVIKLNRNLGFAAAANLGVQASKGCDWVAVLNNDAFADDNWLMNLVAAAETLPNCGSCASRLVFSHEPEYTNGTGDSYHVSGFAWKMNYGRPVCGLSGSPQQVFSASASAALFHRESFITAGGFDEDYFCYFEDVDLGFRLRLLGKENYCVQDAVVRHVDSATYGPKSEFALYHAHRNMVWTYFKNMPLLLLLLYLPQHILFNILSVFWYCRKEGKPVFKAKLHAIAGLPKFLQKRRKVQRARVIPVAKLRTALRKGWIRPYVRTLRDA